MKKLFIVMLLMLGLSANEVYKVGLSPGYPPFEFIKDGKISGFDVDLVNEIAKKLNIKVEFVSMEFDGLIAAIKAGKIDIIASGMNKTPEREKNVEFSIPYFESMNYYVKLQDNDKINSLQDLEKGATIGAQIGTIQANEISKIKGVKPYLNAEHMVFILATLNKKIDGFILESAVAKGYMKNYPNFSVFAKTKIEGDGVCIAFQKGNLELKNKFDNAIKELKTDGTYQKLLDKYELNQ